MLLLTALYILMSCHIQTMANSQATRLTHYEVVRVAALIWRRNQSKNIRQTLCCGNQILNISCGGEVRGVKGIQVGTLSVPQWHVHFLEVSSIFTQAEKITFSHIMNARLRNHVAQLAKPRLRIIGSTLVSFSSMAAK